MLKHLKRMVPKALMSAAALALLLFAAPVAGQTRADSLRAELVRARGFLRAAETQLSKTLTLASPPEPGPPVVLDWRSGEWSVFAAGFRGVLDLSAGTATWEGVAAPIAATFAGDTLRVRIGIPGWIAGGLLELRHAEGRMIGTVSYAGETREATAQRADLQVVRVVEESGCSFAQYTDGSWGVAPFTGPCHDALDTYVGGMRFVARQFTP